MPKWTETSTISNINLFAWIQWAELPWNIWEDLPGIVYLKGKEIYFNKKESTQNNNKCMKLDIIVRSQVKEQYPYAIINADYVEYSSRIPLFYWCCLGIPIYKIPLMSQFEYSTQWLSIVKCPLSIAICQLLILVWFLCILAKSCLTC